MTKQYFQFLIKFFPVILFAGIFISCENDLKKVAEITENNLWPSETAKKIEVYFSDSGKVTMKLTAGKLERYNAEKSRIELSDSVYIEFYDSIKKPENIIYAQRMTHFEDEKYIEARNNVVVKNKKGETLNTEYLKWNQEDETIFTDQFVKISTEKEIITGHGLEADQNFSKYKIKKVIGTFTIDSEEDENN